MDKVRVAVVQYELRKISSFEDFAEQCSFFAKTAALYNIDFLVYPELHTTQLLSFIDAETAPQAARRMSEYTERYVALFSTLAKAANCYIIGGSHFCLEGDDVYNISYFFHRDGRYEKQYKIHVTPIESSAWGVKAGSRVEVFETDRAKVSVLICYDIEFPETARLAAQKGAQIIFCPSNTDQRFGYLRVRYCSQARAIENQLYVVLTGVSGNLPMRIGGELGTGGGEIHYSQSAIFTPSDLPFPQGAVLAEAEPNVETMIIQDLDLSLLEHNRNNGAVRPWSDRRTDLYRVHFREDTSEHHI